MHHTPVPGGEKKKKQSWMGLQKMHFCKNNKPEKSLEKRQEKKEMEKPISTKKARKGGKR